MPYRRNSNNATHKRKTTAVHTGKDSKKRAKRTIDVSRPDMAHPQPSSDKTFIPDSQPDQTEDQRQKQQVPESISNLPEQHFQSSPAQALLVRNRTPDVQFSTPVFDSAIHSRQPDVLTKFRFECSPTKQQFQSSPAQAHLARIRTPDVQFSTPVFDSAIHSRQPDVLTKFRLECSSPPPTRFTIGGAASPKPSSPTRASPTTRMPVDV